MIEFYITRIVSFEVWGDSYIITPAIYDNEGNLIEKAVYGVHKKLNYEPKIMDKYKDAHGYITSKYNSEYYVLQVFASDASHDRVKANLLPEDGFYLGSTLQSAKDVIDNNSNLSALITSEGMVEGWVRGNI